MSLAHNQSVGKVISHSKREVRSFVGRSILLEPGEYTIVCTAFSHWTQGEILKTETELTIYFDPSHSYHNSELNVSHIIFTGLFPYLSKSSSV